MSYHYDDKRCRAWRTAPWDCLHTLSVLKVPNHLWYQSFSRHQSNANRRAVRTPLNACRSHLRHHWRHIYLFKQSHQITGNTLSWDFAHFETALPPLKYLPSSMQVVVPIGQTGWFIPETLQGTLGRWDASFSKMWADHEIFPFSCVNYNIELLEIWKLEAWISFPLAYRRNLRYPQKYFNFRIGSSELLLCWVIVVSFSTSIPWL